VTLHGAAFSMQYPEGWVQRSTASGTTLQDKNNLVRIVVRRGTAPSAAQVSQELQRQKQTTPSLQAGAPSSVTVGGKQAIKVSYTTQSAANNYARLPFPNNQIPITRESPLAKYLYSITPLPTTDANPLVGPNWFGLGFNNTDQNTETVKIDQRVSSKDQLAFRYSHNPSIAAQTSSSYGSSPATLDKKANAYIDEGQNDTGTANWTHTFSPSLFSETLVTVSRDYRGQLPYTHSEEISSKLGLPNPFKGIGFPRIPYTLSGDPSSNMNYDSGINPTIDYATVYNIDQNFTKARFACLYIFQTRDAQQAEIAGAIVTESALKFVWTINPIT